MTDTCVKICKNSSDTHVYFIKRNGIQTKRYSTVIYMTLPIKMNWRGFHHIFTVCQIMTELSIKNIRYLSRVSTLQHFFFKIDKWTNYPNENHFNYKLLHETMHQKNLLVNNSPKNLSKKKKNVEKTPDAVC